MGCARPKSIMPLHGIIKEKNNKQTLGPVIARPVKMSAVKPDNLSLITYTHMVGKKIPHKLSSNSMPVHTHNNNQRKEIKCTF